MQGGECMDRIMGNTNKKSAISLIAIVLMFIILAGLFLVHTYNTQMEDTKLFLKEITKQSTSVIDKKIDGDLFALNCFASYLGSSDMSIGEIVSLLKLESSIQNSSIMRFGFIQNSGEGYAVSGDKLVNKVDLRNTIQYSDYFNEDIDVTENRIDRVTGELVNVYTVPVFCDGVQVGIHCGVIKTENFKKLMTVSYFEGAGFSFIVNNEGRVVVEPNIELKQGEVSPVPESMLGYIDFSNITTEGKIVTLNDGKKYWLNINKLNCNDWYMIMAVPFSAISDKSNAITLMTGIILLLTFTVSCILITYIFNLKNESRKLLLNMAYIDELTKIYNKNGFSRDLEGILDKYNSGYAIVALDIDNFKFINELYGHDEGDGLLRHCAKVIQGNLREDEICARTSSDNFLMLIRFEDDQDIKGRLFYVMNKISSYKFSIDVDTRFDIIMYSGVYKISKSNWKKGPEFIIDRAKMSLLCLEKKHQNDIGFYNDAVRKKIVFETEIENEMYDGLNNGEFEVYLQPKNDVKTGGVAGAEALIRWNHSTKGFLTPNTFIHLFEMNGFVINIDTFVLEEVCKLQRRWLDEGFEPYVISVNQSRLHLYRRDYVECLANMLKKYDLSPDYIELEITENIALSSSSILSDVIEKLHGIGFKVSMDDFGSGQSSLNILKDVDIDVLKIDRLFFNDLNKNDKGKQVISSVIDMANKLSITTVSEGVETDEQFEFLKQVGCDYAQGYLFDKPMPMKEFEIKFKQCRKKDI